MSDFRHLISACLLQEISVHDLKKRAGLHAYTEVESNAIYEISLYRITYKTTYMGMDVSASGLICVPKNTAPTLPIISFHHGSMFLKSLAPSRSAGYIGVETFSALGYVILFPDYVGYGDSELYFHPYYDKAYAAQNSLDFLRSALEFLKENSNLSCQKLFLAGYSEGGYVTLALQKELEREGLGISLTAVAAGAGGYDLFNMLSGFTNSNNTHVKPSYLVFLIMAYEKIYGWNKSLEYFFRPDFAAILPELMNGTHDSEYVDAHLSNDLSILFNPSFYTNLRATGEMDLKKALFINSLADWKPVTPLRLYHGDADETIPYGNTVLTYENFIAQKAINIEMIILPGCNHHTGFSQMVPSAMAWFGSMASES